MAKKKLLKQLQRAIDKEDDGPTLNPAKTMFVRDFLDVMRARHARGETLISTRDVMRALACGPEDVTACLSELRDAGVEFHHTDRLDETLPTVESRGDRFSYIGVALNRAARK